MGHVVQEGSTPNEDWFINETHRKTLSPISNEERMKVYDEWAPRYEDDIMNTEVTFPVIKEKILSLLQEREKVNKSLRLLDAGCGTGGPAEVYAPALKQLCMDVHKVGLDFSAGMLALARKKNLYDELVQADISKPLPSSCKLVDVVVSVGVFFSNHVEAFSLKHLLVCLKPKGYALLTVRTKTYKEEAATYQKVIGESGCEIVLCEERTQRGPKTCMVLTVQMK